MAFNGLQFDGVHFETSRLFIRCVKQADTDALFEIYSDPLSMQYWSTPVFNELSQAQNLVDSAIKNVMQSQAFLFVVLLKSSRQVIGTLSLFHLHGASRRAEIGYILSSHFWRQGLMTEALGALFHYCFNTLGLNRLEADIDPENLGSRALLLKLGFEKEGLLKQRWLVNGQYSDSEIYGLIKSQYQ